LTDTNKRLLIWESWRFKSMYTLQRKLDQHTTHILRSVHVWSSTIRISRGPHIATFRESLTGLDICTTLEKKCSRLHLSAQLSGPRDLPQFLFQYNHWSSALNPSTCWWQATRLAELISPACDQYVQYLPTGSTHRSLTDTGGGLQRWRCWLTTSHSPTFPINGPPLFTKGPVRSQVINSIPIELEMEQTLNLTSESFHSTFTVSYHLSIAWVNNEPPR
jgi:hypothetical protein